MAWRFMVLLLFLASCGEELERVPHETSTNRLPEEDARILDLIGGLQAHSASERKEAIEKLAAMGAPAVSTLRNVLRNQAARMAALEALLRMGAPAETAMPEIASCLEDPDMYVRWKAAKVLRSLGGLSTAAVPDLIAALSDEKAIVRAEAATALGAIGEGAAVAVPSLVRMLEDEDVEVRRDAAIALGSIGPPASAAVPMLVRAFEESEEVEFLWALAEIGPSASEALDPLLDRALEHSNLWIREEALELLTRALPLRALGHADPEVRTQAARSLAKSQPEASWIPTLLKALDDDVAWVRGPVLECLERLGVQAEEAAPRLLKILVSDLTFLRRGAAATLASIGETTIPAIRKEYKAAPLHDRIWLAHALYLLNAPPEDALLMLRKALTSERPEVLADAAWVAGEVGASARGLAPEIAHLLQNDRDHVRWQAAWALGKLGGVAAVRHLSTSVRDEDDLMRSTVAVALGAIGPAARNAAPELRKLLSEDDSSGVRLAAAVALVRICGGGDPALEYLIDLVLDDRNLEPRKAVLALGGLGPEAERAIPCLEEIQRTGNRWVAEAARKALEKIRGR